MAIKTVSLETAKALKKAGFRQEAYFWHIVGSRYKGLHHVKPSSVDIRHDVAIAAPTTDELLEELPKELNGAPMEIQFVKGWLVFYDDKDILERVKSWSMNQSLPEALAQMWLWLKKEGLIK